MKHEKSNEALGQRMVDTDTLTITDAAHSRESGRIVSTPDTLGGSWRIAGTRIPTRALFSFHEGGHSTESIAYEYPGITPDDVRAAIRHELHLKEERKLKREAAVRHRCNSVSRAVILEPDRTLWLYDADGERGPMLPGGHVEHGETAEQAVTRECREETGFDVEVIRWLIDVRDEHSTRHYYLVRRVGGEPTSEDADSGVAVRMRRVSIEDAVTLLVSAFDVAAVRQAEHGARPTAQKE